MKRMGLRVTAIVIFLLAFGASNVGSFLLGRAMVENRVIPWEETRTFYAQIVESQGSGSFLVEGLAVNDLNHRGRFTFSLEEGTSLVWRGTSLSPDDLEAGHRVAVTYTGPVAESEPGQIYQVLRLEVLGDELKKNNWGFFP